MCGITGFVTADNALKDPEMASIGISMANSLSHRGPDSSGVWTDENAGIALAHRRLSILDLTSAGDQPMTSVSGRYVIVFNGEIYNHLEMRQELNNDKGWRGHSDTETLLAGFEKWGIDQTLKRTVGMFAIALWDRKEKVLTLARDRIGEKPLYYGFQKGTLIFGSELKALKRHPDFVGEIDRDVICLYLRHCYIPAPYSIYKGIFKLLPGHYISFKAAHGPDTLRSAKPEAYWRLSEVAANGIARPFAGNEADAISELEERLKRAIKLQMVADVPLGVFLSGGIDSSTVVALMQAQSGRPVKTFSVGFKEMGYNEAEYAKAVSGHLGTDHTEQYVSPAEAMQVIPKLGSMYDEPFADSSQIPTFLISQMARKYVKVSLSGDAGDELFCGYNRYALADMWKNVSRVPFAIRKSAGRLIKAIAPSTWDRVFRYIGKFFTLPSNMGEKLEKLSTRLENVDGVGSLYYSLVSEIADPDRVVIDAREPGTWLTETGLKETFADYKVQMMYMDSMTYLPDDILVKVDRAAMFNSLETRIPFLDHRIIDLVWSLPLSMKMRDGQTKWMLRCLLYKYIPKSLIERPKMGFGVPVGDWMRGRLKDWAQNLLDESRLQREGLFDAQFIRTRWKEHLSGKRNWQYFLWTILMFQEWSERAEATD
ncbi:MAG: asparagine synthase (glutamine-hydrolyzing) [Candidatus Omnitrophota bacterium]|nr:asparagine synthase (glutamine-hydrolyzing) [Candidatus Omnitrophota bacterium]